MHASMRVSEARASASRSWFCEAGAESPKVLPVLEVRPHPPLSPPRRPGPASGRAEVSARADDSEGRIGPPQPIQTARSPSRWPGRCHSGRSGRLPALSVGVDRNECHMSAPSTQSFCAQGQPSCQAREACSRRATSPCWMTGSSACTLDWGQFHHASTSSRSMVASSKRRRTSLAGVPATIE